MLLPRLDLRRFFWLGVIAAIAGCRPPEQIAKYTVTKPELIDPTLTAVAPPAVAPPQQLLAAMVQAGEQSWFFKLTGDPAVVEPSRTRFLDFVKSIKFSAGTEPRPTWTLPADWEELPGNQIRLATLRFQSGGQPLEITVIPAGGTVLDNVNRWRKQVNLEPIPADELASTTESFKVDGRPCTFASLVGTRSSGGGPMGSAPFAPFAGGATSAPPPVSPKSAGPPAGGDLKYDAPKEWSTAPNNAVSVAAFEVTDGKQRVEITVSPVGGDLLSNVNRWRDQVGLPPLDIGELAKSLQKIATLGATGDYVEAVGPGDVTAAQTILGVRVDAGGGTWFIKLRGDRDLAAREKAHFEAFVKSLQFR